MRRPLVRQHRIGVEMLIRNALLISQQHRLRPMDKIRGCFRHDGADSVHERPMIRPIFPDSGIPKCEVLRIERSFRNHRFFVGQFPAKTIRRLKNIEPLFPRWPPTGDSSIPGLGACFRITILKNSKAVRPQTIQDDVVFY